MTDEQDGGVPPKKKRAKGCLWAVGIFVALGVIGSFLPDPPPQTPKEAHERRADAHLDGLKKCRSAWDGSVHQLNSAIKDRLNDPRSFEHDETGLINLEAYREAVAIIEDDTQSPDAKFYAGQEIRVVSVLPPRDYNGGGTYYAVTHYRARNAFGGMVRGSARATLKKDCSVHTLISVQ